MIARLVLIHSDALIVSLCATTELRCIYRRIQKLDSFVTLYRSFAFTGSSERGLQELSIPVAS